MDQMFKNKLDWGIQVARGNILNAEVTHRFGMATQAKGVRYMGRYPCLQPRVEGVLEEEIASARNRRADFSLFAFTEKTER